MVRVCEEALSHEQRIRTQGNRGHSRSIRGPSRSLAVLLTLVLASSILVSTGLTFVTEPTVPSADQPQNARFSAVQASLLVIPGEVKRYRPVIVLAEISGQYSDVEFLVNISICVTRSGMFGFTYYFNLTYQPLLAVQVPEAGGWWFVCIPGLPARTVSIVNDWVISSSVQCALNVDGSYVAETSYTVLEVDATSNLSPVVFTSVYDIVNDNTLVNETCGLGPRGWRAPEAQSQKTVIVAFDDGEISEVFSEYSVSGGSWESLPAVEDPEYMGPINTLVSGLDAQLEEIELLPSNPFGLLPRAVNSIKIMNSVIPARLAGDTVRFRSSVNDDGGNSGSSPEGFYYVTSAGAETRLLVVDPHVELRLLGDNLLRLVEKVQGYSSYEFPAQLIADSSRLKNVSDAVESLEIIPFHHWEMLAQGYDIYITRPDLVGSLARNISEGGYEPHVVVLSNMWLGLETSNDTSRWNWDLESIPYNGSSTQKSLIGYIKWKHAGLIATHGTLSDWIVGGPDGLKIGTRGHIGSTIPDANPVDERTMAAMLGMPELAVWEFVRDEIARELQQFPETAEIGLLVGSLPLQVAKVPLNSTMRTTIQATDHPILNGIPLEFNLTSPSVLMEYGYPSQTQVGWQLGSAGALAYEAWLESNLSLADGSTVSERLGTFIEEISGIGAITENVSSIAESLGWGLRNFYESLTSAQMSGENLNLSVRIPGLAEPYHLSKTVDLRKLLDRFPVKLLALSEDRKAGIVSYDKFWDSNGYRSVYFSMEPESNESSVARDLLVNSVEWCIDWSYTTSTELLGSFVRVTSDFADRFDAVSAALPGSNVDDSVLLLNENGSSNFTVNVAAPTTMYVAVAHPNASSVDVSVVGCNAVIVSDVTSDNITVLEIDVSDPGDITISMNSSSPDSSLIGSYVLVKTDDFMIPEFTSMVGSVVGFLCVALTVILRRRRNS